MPLNRNKTSINGAL